MTNSLNEAAAMPGSNVFDARHGAHPLYMLELFVIGIKEMLFRKSFTKCKLSKKNQ